MECLCPKLNFTFSLIFHHWTELTHTCHFTTPQLLPCDTGYSFWDQLHNFHTNLHELFCQFISLRNWVNSGKFMDTCWISCQVMADMEKFYDDFIIINLYKMRFHSDFSLFLNTNQSNYETDQNAYTLDAVRSSQILIGKQRLGRAFNSDKLGGIDFTKFSKLTMCSAGASRCWLVQWPGLPPRHCTWSVLKFL